MDRNVVFYERRRRQEKDFFASGFFSSAPLSLGADQSDRRFFFSKMKTIFVILANGFMD
jgi:hypothetical protein